MAPILIEVELAERTVPDADDFWVRIDSFPASAGVAIGPFRGAAHAPVRWQRRWFDALFSALVDAAIPRAFEVAESLLTEEHLYVRFVDGGRVRIRVDAIWRRARARGASRPRDIFRVGRGGYIVFGSRLSASPVVEWLHARLPG